MQRHSIGLDVDPVATAVASAKTHRYQPARLRTSAQTVIESAQLYARPESEYKKMMFEDLSDSEFESEQSELTDFIPAIPNLNHWFRRYVVVDLANIRRAIARAPIPATHGKFFNAVFASIIRNSSNADPVPVSGLEVTAHMKRLEEQGRLINPFALFSKAMTKALDAAEGLYKATVKSVSTRVMLGDAVHLGDHISRVVDAVITSPPYHGAVDYYRRHKLEMFWLGLTTNHQQRLQLLDKYIGRPQVPQRDSLLKSAVLRNTLAKEWESRIREVSAKRADSFRHYILAMTRVFEGLSQLLKHGSPAVFVVGHSSWNSAEIPTSTLFEELAGDWFHLENLLSYPVKNRYMSYTRHNGADILTEYVLVLRRSTAASGEEQFCQVPEKES